VQSAFFEYAKKKGCTPAQLALAWLHAQGEDIFPIPGTKSPMRVEENLGAFKVVLTAQEAIELADIVEKGTGARYSADGMTSTFEGRVEESL
jgi:aryl-alcohol dehydrogenase-like predicted oxidoreductase